MAHFLAPTPPPPPPPKKQKNPPEKIPYISGNGTF